ncbi:uncharacterized protein EV422DRAFT_272625 [Fimicolochytrium jonesii]|uniref:uncharacterized protein n=1 Tax=Fimicolochytrium jonesii TaxID=1396493 RepID=UPI0022FE2CAA|nr:uncharacterized protein EV422DRAFT_272625 [Fimicolochytrium jonesii]KAI8816862.1 hypothetical protein EV422DRAFT_272625 [Fimicolochytrium jonesii]
MDPANKPAANPPIAAPKHPAHEKLQQPSSSSTTLLKPALAAFKRSDYACCIRILTKALETDPQNVKLLDCRALAKLNVGDWDGALDDAQAIVRVDGSNIKGYLHAGKAFRLMGKNEHAAKIYRIAKKKVGKENPRYQDLEMLLQECSSPESTSTTVTKKRTSSQTPASSPAPKKSKQAPQDLPLPYELFSLILSHLPLATLTRCTAVSRTWRAALHSDKRLWTTLDFSTHGRRVTNLALTTVVAKAGSRLKHLSLKNCGGLTSGGWKCLAVNKCNALLTLDLTACRGIPPAAFVEALQVMARSLTAVDLTATKADDLTVRKLLDCCRALKDLTLAQCDGITDDAFAICDNFQRKRIPLTLQTVDLTQCNITDKAVTLIAAGAPSLTSLTVTKCPRITLTTLAALATHSRHLTALALSGISLLDPPTLCHPIVATALFRANPSLASLTLPSCPQLALPFLQPLAAHCAGLTHIEFAQSAQLTNDALALLAASCTQLQSVRIPTCPRVSDPGAVALLTQLTQLAHLDVSNNAHISDSTLEAVVAHGAALVYLAVGNTRVSGVGVGRLVGKVGAALREVVVDHCVGVGAGAVEVLRRGLGVGARVRARFG